MPPPAPSRAQATLTFDDGTPRDESAPRDENAPRDESALRDESGLRGAGFSLSGGDEQLSDPGDSEATESADDELSPFDDGHEVGEDEPGAVLVTGICGRLGKLLVRRLHRTERVVGIDRRRFPDKPKDVIHYQVDVRRKKTRDVFRTERVAAVVHLGVLHDPRVGERERHNWNIVAFQKLLDYIVEYEVKKLVVLSSAAVYGPHADNPQFLAEDAPLLGAQGFGAIRDLVELDMLAQSFFWRHPDTETVILRPCHILGGVHNAASNYLRLERPVTVMGFDPMMQAIHELDVVRAIEHALRPGAKGIFNLRGPGEMPLSKIFRKLGTSPIPIPGALATTVLDRAFRYHLSSFPAPELDHLRYICMVDGSRARDVLGFTPAFTLDQTIEAVVSPRAWMAAR